MTLTASLRGPDNQVHQVKGFNYYTEFSFWDTFRAEDPLLTLIQPARVNDIVKTCLAHYRFTEPGKRFLPVWLNSGRETGCMIGHHSIPVIVDAYLKGFRDWDAAEALADMEATTGLNREQQDTYRRIGYVPHRRSDQARPKRSNTPMTTPASRGWPAPWETRRLPIAMPSGPGTGSTSSTPAAASCGAAKKAALGLPFDPKRIDTQDFTEANSWQYTFFVPHDIPALIEKMGGDEKFAAKLDEMFDTKEKMPNTLPDITGVIGMYAHGNEPCHQVAYLYNYAGQPWRTQARVRKVATAIYDNTPGGICGNDDCGQISAWYVFTALGFYPVDPTGGVYIIGSPFMDRVAITLDPKYYKGGTFTVIAKDNSPTNMYIQSATLNGQPYMRSWITHEQIVAGRVLTLQMGPAPNRQWARHRRTGRDNRSSDTRNNIQNDGPHAVIVALRKTRTLLFGPVPFAFS